MFIKFTVRIKLSYVSMLFNCYSLHLCKPNFLVWFSIVASCRDYNTLLLYQILHFPKFWDYVELMYDMYGIVIPHLTIFRCNVLHSGTNL
jgi:hypothetical protein